MPRRERNRKKTNRQQKEKKNPVHAPFKKIALLGFRGAGKSSIARELSGRWQSRVVSLDREIEEKAGMSIEEIVKAGGWQRFRALEKELLNTISETDEEIILDTGGGIIENADGSTSEEKIDILKTRFFSIYLHVDDDRILRRLQKLAENSSRPPLPGGREGLKEALQRRKPAYHEAASAVVEISDVHPPDAAERIYQLLKNRTEAGRKNQSQHE